MRINIITRHSPSNYGSLLQSLATIKVLEKMGHDASIIDYVRSDDLGLDKVWTEAQIKGGSVIKKLAYVLIRYPVEKLAENRFQRMRKRLLKMTQRVSSQKELEKLNADFFVTGSDQVWGPMVNGQYDPAYFLSFASTGKKLAYAASFGKTSFDEETENKYKQMLCAYDKIAVREKSAVKLIEKWNGTNCVGQVLDPSLLLSGDDWRRLFDLKEKEDEPYILTYQIHNDANLSKYAKNLATHKKMKLIRVNPFLHQCFRGGKFRLCPDVKEFLNLINNATYMVTDSFHGTCFAINFNKQFVEILPNNATGTRNQSILSVTNLSSRIVSNYSDFSIVDNPIDYGEVNGVLLKERVKSIEILKGMLAF